jgi:hypothetical protein
MDRIGTSCKALILTIGLSTFASASYFPPLISSSGVTASTIAASQQGSWGVGINNWVSSASVSVNNWVSTGTTVIFSSNGVTASTAAVVIIGQSGPNFIVDASTWGTAANLWNVKVPLSIQLSSGTPANPLTVSVPLSLQLSSGTPANPFTVSVPLSLQLSSGTPTNPFTVVFSSNGVQASTTNVMVISMGPAVQLASGTLANPLIVNHPLSIQLSSGTPANPFTVSIPLSIQLSSGNPANPLTVHDPLAIQLSSGTPTSPWTVVFSSNGVQASTTNVIVIGMGPSVQLASGTLANPLVVSVPLSLQLSSGTPANPFNVTVPLSLQLSSGTPANPFNVTVPLSLQLSSGTIANPFIIDVATLTVHDTADNLRVVGYGLNMASVPVNVIDVASVTVNGQPNINVVQWGNTNVLTGGSNGSVGVGGLAATGATAVGNPNQFGGLVSSSAVQGGATNARIEPIAVDPFGRIMVVGGVGTWQILHSTAILLNTVVPQVIISSAGAATFSDICYCSITNTSASADYVVFQSTGSQNSTAATQTPPAFTIAAAASSSAQYGMGGGCATPIPQKGPNTNWTVAANTAVTDIRVDCWYYTIVR